MLKDCNKESIDKLIDENEMVLIYFGSDTCSVCTALKPKVDELLKGYPEIKSIQIDVEKSLQLTAAFDVFTVPVILVFIEGRETIREARHISIMDIDNKIERYYDLLFR